MSVTLSRPSQSMPREPRDDLHTQCRCVPPSVQQIDPRSSPPDLSWEWLDVNVLLLLPPPRGKPKGRDWRSLCQARTTRMGLCWLRWFDPALVSFEPSRGSSLTNICTKVPTRLFALKYGASLVWGPEIVDKAILHAERVVDRTSRPFPSDPSFRWPIAVHNMIDRCHYFQR